MKTSIKPSFKEVVIGCKRHNHEAIQKLYWFSSKISIYISYFLIRLGISADQATILFFIIGLIGSFMYISVSPVLTCLGYIFWRLHHIIDLSDGDIARFNKSFSVRGAYWDAVIHSVLNPLYYIFICFSFYLQFDNNLFIIIGAFLGLTSSLLFSVKNNYFKALLHNGIAYNKESASNDKRSGAIENIKYIITYFFSEICGLEGFVFLAVIIRIINLELYAFMLIFLYLILNFSISFIKFYQLSYTGKTFSKS